MSDDKKPDQNEDQNAGSVGAEEVTDLIADFTERSTKIAEAFCARQENSDMFDISAPNAIGKAFWDMTEKMIAEPEKMWAAQANLWSGYAKIWEENVKRLAGETVEPVAVPGKGDKRFKDSEWTENALFDTIKQSYLLSSQWVQSTVGDVEGLDPKTKEKVDFYTRQYMNALSPSNFAATNPQVLRETVETKGENLLNGFQNLLGDMEKGEGQLKISITDEDAFTVGENIGVSPGKVVYQNDMMQLIQYAPLTDKVSQVPLLIVPPWINKFYILDLQPKKSLIKWAVEKGHTVFVISWVNPDETLSDRQFDDYILEGPIAALDAIKQATGEKDVNVISYCIGGTLMACTLAYMAAKKDDRVKSVTFMTTMVDFEEAGELSVFIDEEQLDELDEQMADKGFLEGGQMSQIFSMMRENDMIWSFVVNNYLLGKEPMPFDLLYWNSDNTRMPAQMHSKYLREMYLKNNLIKPGAIEMNGVPLDLTLIKTPAYILSTKDDHIAPWKSTYRITDHLKGPAKFVLAASGHVAGVVNPPAAGKYCYWTNSKLPKDADGWFEGAKSHEGSWWVDWDKWVKKYRGKQVAARIPGEGKLKAIEGAPGSYVKVRIG